MEVVQISKYDLVREADAMQLNEREAFVYIRNSGETISRKTYFIYKKKIKARKRQSIYDIAKCLPEVHIDQIESLKIVRKKLYMAFLSATDPKELTDLSRAIAEIERQISDYNGWTQVITEDTLKKFGVEIEAEEPGNLFPQA